MSEPLPGPNVMLPALDLSGPPSLDHVILYKKREALWKRLVSTSHREWCLCGSAANHFLPPHKELKNSTCGEEEDGDCAGGPDVGTEGGDSKEDITDEDMVAAGGEE
nr:ORF2 [Torque teno felis virus]